MFIVRHDVVELVWLTILLTQSSPFLVLQNGVAAAVYSRRYRVVVYRATPSGIAAALSAAETESTFQANFDLDTFDHNVTHSIQPNASGVLLIEATAHVGGMATEGGIGFRDAKNDDLRSDPRNSLYQWGRLNAEYYNEPLFVWQPDHYVGEDSFLKLLQDARIELLTSTDIVEGPDGVHIDTSTSRRIQSIVLENGTIIEADYFIDASYTGDLMRAAAVDSVFGRESAETYNESWGGVTNYSASQFTTYLLPVDDDTDYDSVSHPLKYVTLGLDPNTQLGQADDSLMAYSYRVCLTLTPALAVAVKPPDGYDPYDFELARRLVQSQLDNGLQLSEPWLTMEFMGYPSRNVNNDNIMKYDACCGWSSMGIDAVGLSRGYATASRDERKQMEENHRYYVQGLLWFWRSDPVVPPDIREQYLQYGLCNDSWIDNDHFPRQLYVREASRLVGDKVFTQRDRNEDCKPDSIAVGNWGLDVHDMRRIAFMYTDVDHFNRTSWRIMNEGLRGSVEQQGGVFPFEIPYWTILPKREQLANLAVVSCPSFSHVAFAAARVEPTLWTLGQAAGIAAILASKLALVSLHDVDIETLQQSLIDQGAVIHWPPDRDCAI